MNARRPNPIGLSVVAFDGFDGEDQLLVRFLDCADGTPLLDIKPYLPTTDADFVVEGCTGWRFVAEELAVPLRTEVSQLVEELTPVARRLDCEADLQRALVMAARELCPSAAHRRPAPHRARAHRPPRGTLRYCPSGRARARCRDRRR